MSGRSLSHVDDARVGDSEWIGFGSPSVIDVLNLLHGLPEEGYACKIAAPVKWIQFNICHTAWNRNGIQSAAIFECVFSDSYHAISKHNACQSAATEEWRPSNGRYSITNYQIRQPGTQAERSIPDAGDTVGKYHTRKL